jgi:hypothetical protein
VASARIIQKRGEALEELRTFDVNEHEDDWEIGFSGLFQENSKGAHRKQDRREVTGECLKFCFDCSFGVWDRRFEKYTHCIE